MPTSVIWMSSRILRAIENRMDGPDNYELVLADSLTLGEGNYRMQTPESTTNSDLNEKKRQASHRATPASCIAVSMAEADGISNFSLLTANKTMPAAYEMLKDFVDVYLYPGHVNAVMGNSECRALAERGISGVVSGFTANELLTALAVAVIKSQQGKPFFVNAYPRVVTEEGSIAAREMMDKYLETYDCEWRGLGIIKGSGKRLKSEYAAFDARKKYGLPKIEGRPNPACRCGEVLQGKIKPSECPCFGKACEPLHPVGACMVSNEGACSAYYQYGGEL